MNIQKHALALASLSRFLKSSNTRQNNPPPILCLCVAQRVSFATLHRPHEIKVLRVAYVSSKTENVYY
jgi:hypothetical protein